MTAFPCILCQRLQVQLDGHFCAVHAVAGVLRSVWLTHMCLCYAETLHETLSRLVVRGVCRLSMQALTDVLQGDIEVAGWVSPGPV